MILSAVNIHQETIEAAVQIIQPSFPIRTFNNAEILSLNSDIILSELL